VPAASNKTLLPVQGPETMSMQTQDGVRLDADVYRPERQGDFPVLLMRQPYGRRIASTVTYAHPSWYAANGFIAVIQDVRGRGTSEGSFRLFVDDVRDGGDTIAWAARLPGSTGRVGMYGFSYHGRTQFLALAADRPELRALCPAMATWDIRTDWAYEGGAFCFLLNLGWGLQMAAEQARLAGDAEAFDALLAAARALPLHSPRPCRPEVLEAFGRYSHYGDWIKNQDPGPYWEEIAVGRALEGKPMNVPMLHIGGWHDFMLRGTLRAYREARARSSKPQHLLVGPWTHMPWGRQAGAVDFGPAAVSDVDALQVAWFNRFLKDVDNGVDRAPRVKLFDLIAKCWRDFDEWPQDALRAFYTSSEGLASSTACGRLSAQPAARAVSDVVVHDPWRPVPTLGGHNAELAGMRERSEIDQRNDVLTYTTAPLPAALTLAGDVELTLDVGADQPCFDISAVLSRVTPDGRAYNLTQGHARVENQRAAVRVGMRALCATLPAGDSLRLSLAAASFPAFAVNPGTGAPPAEARQIDNRIITLVVRSGGASPTHINLPVMNL
jgi:putative CocE/NonD family hydrolase